MIKHWLCPLHPCNVALKNQQKIAEMEEEQMKFDEENDSSPGTEQTAEKKGGKLGKPKDDRNYTTDPKDNNGNGSGDKGKNRV